MYKNLKRENDIILAKYINYMKRSIYNARINYLKHQKFTKTKEKYLDYEEWLQLFDIDNCNHFFFDLIELEEYWESEKITKAFEELTDLQKKVMYLNVGKEIPMSYIGRFLNVSTKSVEKTKARALRRLKKYLEEE